MNIYRLVALFTLLGISSVAAQPFDIHFAQPTLDRWMYPFNSSPGTRPSAPTFGTLGDESGVDTRHGQFLLGFDTTNQVPTNLPPRNYLIRSVKFTAVNLRHETFALDPTPDAFASYLPTNSPDYSPDMDTGRPIELYGASFRNGFTAATFPENGPFGSSAAGGRNAFAAGYNDLGQVVDVGNNVGKTNSAFQSFESFPFAVGTSTTVSAGQVVPSDTQLIFDFDLSNPFVVQYVQEALASGQMRLTLSYLGESNGQMGQPTYPDFATRDNALFDPPTLTLECTVIRNLDTDGDGLPDDWENFYFTNEMATATQDTDADGANNLSEYRAGTDPTQSSSVLKVVTFRNANSQFTLEFNFAASRSYQIEYSADLITWVPVTNPILRFPRIGIARWADDGTQTGGLNGVRFYRVSPR